MPALRRMHPGISTLHDELPVTIPHLLSFWLLLAQTMVFRAMQAKSSTCSNLISEQTHHFSGRVRRRGDGRALKTTARRTGSLVQLQAGRIAYGMKPLLVINHSRQCGLKRTTPCIPLALLFSGVIFILFFNLKKKKKKQRERTFAIHPSG